MADAGRRTSLSRIPLYPSAASMPPLCIEPACDMGCFDSIRPLASVPAPKGTVGASRPVPPKLKS